MVIRAEIVDLLHSCGCFTLQERGAEESFLSGTGDFAIGDLRMDSLSAMEFCIALENRWGLSASPDDLERLGSLNRLVSVLGGDE